jgi:hypothetical protein
MAVRLQEIAKWLENYRRFSAQSFERLDSLLDELKNEKKK